MVLASFVLVALSSLAAAEELYGSPEGNNACLSTCMMLQRARTWWMGVARDRIIIIANAYFWYKLYVYRLAVN